MKCLSALAFVAFALSPLPSAADDRGEWELILTFFEAGSDPQTRLYGVMVSQEACHIAGQAVAEMVMRAAPTIMVGVTCRVRISA